MAFSSLLRCRQGVSASLAPSALITVVTILRSSFYPALESLVTGDWRAATRWRPRLTSGCLSLSQIPFIISLSDVIDIINRLALMELSMFCQHFTQGL